MSKQRKQPWQSSASYFDNMQEKVYTENIKRRKVVKNSVVSQPELLFLQFNPNAKDNNGSFSNSFFSQPSGSSKHKKSWQPPIKVTNQPKNTELGETCLSNNPTLNNSQFLEESKETSDHYFERDISNETYLENEVVQSDFHSISFPEKTSIFKINKLNNEQESVENKENKTLFNSRNIYIESPQKELIPISDGIRTKYDCMPEKSNLSSSQEISAIPKINGTSEEKGTLEIFCEYKRNQLKFEKVYNIINKQIDDGNLPFSLQPDSQSKGTTTKSELSPVNDQIEHLETEFQSGFVNYNKVEYINNVNKDSPLKREVSEQENVIEPINLLTNESFINKCLENQIEPTVIELNYDYEGNESIGDHGEVERYNITSREIISTGVQAVEKNREVDYANVKKQSTNLSEHEITTKQTDLIIRNDSVLNRTEEKEFKYVVKDRKETIEEVVKSCIEDQIVKDGETDCIENKEKISTVQDDNKEDNESESLTIDLVFASSISPSDYSEEVEFTIGHHPNNKKMSDLQNSEISREIKSLNTCVNEVDEEVNNKHNLGNHTLTPDMQSMAIDFVGENYCDLTPCITNPESKNEPKETIEEKQLQEHEEDACPVEDDYSCMMLTNSQLCEIDQRCNEANRNVTSCNVPTVVVDEERVMKSNKTSTSIGTQTNIVCDPSIYFHEQNTLLQPPSVQWQKNMQETRKKLQYTIQEIERLNAILLRVRQEVWHQGRRSADTSRPSNTSFWPNK